MADRGESCVLAAFMAIQKNAEGHTVPDSLLMESMFKPHDRATFAATDNLFKTGADEIAMKKHPEIYKPVKDFKKQFKYDGILLSAQNTHKALGESFVGPINKAMLEFGQKYGQGKFDLSKYKTEVGPVIANARASMEASVPEHLQQQANDFLNFVDSGGVFAGKIQATEKVKFGTEPFKTAQNMASNVVGAIVKGNPLIAAFNVFEFTPKALVYSIEHKGAAGPLHILDAMARYMKDTNGMFWKQTETLKNAGVYGMFNEAKAPAKGALGKTGRAFENLNDGILNSTERPLRGLSYYLGESLGTGGMDALEKVAFVYQPAHVPALLWHRDASTYIPLMRFSIEALKFHRQMVQNLREGFKAGDIEAITKTGGAMLAFAAMNTIQTGIETNIPALFWNMFPEDWQDRIKAINEAVPIFNIAGKATGIDFAEKQQLGTPALGIGLSAAQTTIEGIESTMGKASRALSEDGDPLMAAMEIGEGAFLLSMLKGYGFASNTNKKIYRAIKEKAAGKDPDMMRLFNLNEYEPVE